MAERDRYVNVYFVPLPDTVAVANRAVVHFQYDERETPYVASIGQGYDAAKVLAAVGGPLDVVMRFHHVPAGPPRHFLDLAAIVSVSEFTTGVKENVEPVGPDGLPTGPSMLITVAEVATWDDSSPDAASGSNGPTEFEIDDLSVPLLRAIHALQHFVRAHNVATGATTVIPTYQRVGPNILVSQRSTRADAHWEHAVQRLDHNNVTGAVPKHPPIDLDELRSAVARLSAGDVRTVFEETMLQAEALLFKDGDHAGSIVRTAQACEVMFDGLLGLLLWERGGGAPSADGPVEQAAQAFSRDLRPRLRSEYHPLIGGNWDSTTPGALSNWSLLVGEPRNEIVHAGRQPRVGEATDALNAARALEEHVTKLVAARARQHPRTALMWVGNEQLRELNAWPYVQGFVKKGMPSEPPWRDNFAAWRARVTSATTPRRSGTQPRDA